jgi:peroxiredoxin Q/BCP
MPSNSHTQLGSAAPNFELLDTTENKITLDDLKGKWVVLYFYPKDDTPGCTIEATEFSALKSEFEKLDTIILGISPDSCQSHKKFTNKHELSVNLLSDPQHQIIEQYGAWQKKSMYGKEYMGVARSTFLIDPTGIIRYIWPKVKAKGHAEEVKVKIMEFN